MDTKLEKKPDKRRRKVRPREKMVSFSIYIKESDKAILERISTDEKKSGVSAVVRDAIDELIKSYLDRHITRVEKPKPPA